MTPDKIIAGGGDKAASHSALGRSSSQEESLYDVKWVGDLAKPSNAVRHSEGVEWVPEHHHHHTNGGLLSQQRSSVCACMHRNTFP